MKRRIMFVFTVIALFSLAIFPVGAVQAQDPQSPRWASTLLVPSIDANTFVLATNSDVITLDPALAYDTASDEVIQNIYETLVFYDGASASSVIPQLADSYNLSPDKMTYTFHIRSGVTFHNGASLTPSDVAYSFQRGLLQGGYSSPQWLLSEPFFGVGLDDVSLLVDPTGSLAGNRAALSAWNPAELVAACNQVKAAIVADDVAGTVTMHLAQPWGPFLTTIAGTWGSIMDKGWTVAQGGWDGSCNTWQNWYAMNSAEDPFTGIANGTGPFELDHWSPSQEIVLTRNNSYWRTPAQLQNVVLRIVPDDNTRFSILQNGDADQARPVGNYALADEMVGEDCLWNISTVQYDCSVVDASKFLRRYTGRPRINQNHVLINFDIAVPDGGNPYIGSGQLDGSGIPTDFFSDVHIRKALNYCFDWDTYGQVAYGGEFVQGTTLVLEGMPGYDLNTSHYTHDLTACETELGLADVDHDGIPSASDTDDVTQVGFHFQMPYYEGNLARQTIAEILSANMSLIDPKFVVDVVSLPLVDYLAAQRSSHLPIMTGGWQEDIHDPHNWYQPFLVGTYSYRIRMPDDLRAQFSILIDQGVSTTDFSARHAIYQQLNQLVYDNTPLIILGGSTNHDFIQRWVKGRVLNQAFPGNYYYTITKLANIDVTIGGDPMGGYFLVSDESTRATYAGINKGPAQVINTTGGLTIASQRVLYGGKSYSETMGYPNDQLTNEYIFPLYNNVAMDSQLRVSNLGATSTTINVYLGSSPTPIDTYTLGAGAAKKKNYVGKNGGPLRVTSSATNIFTTIRVLYGGTSYSELTGYPANQLAKEYIFPLYNNVAMDSQLRVSNVGAVNTQINVYLGSNPTPIDTYTLGAGAAKKKNYAGKNGGPLRVTSSVTNILTTIRVLYGGNSMSEMLGFPADQLEREYWYPVYDNVGLDSQLRVSNVGGVSTTINVYLGDDPTPIDTYTLGAGAATKKNYPARNGGPLRVTSSDADILTTIRMLYTTPTFTSLYEMMGLPNGWLSSQYWFPLYNNVAMSSELRVAVP